MLKKPMTECATFRKLCFPWQKNLEGAVVSLYFIRKYLLIKSLIFIFFSFIPIALVLFLSTPNVYSVDVRLQWDISTEAAIAGHRIFFREEGEKYNYKSPVWEGNDTTCTISGLINTKIYFFVARSFDICGRESKNSNEIIYFPLIDFAIKGNDPFINTLDKIKGSMIEFLCIYQDLQTVKNTEDKKTDIQIYNKCTGKWIARYKFFKKSCGKDIPFYDEFVSYLENGEKFTRYLQ